MSNEPSTPSSQGPALLQRLFQQATQAQSMQHPPATPEPTAHSTQAVSDLIKSQLGLSTPQPPHPVFSFASQPSSHYTPAPVEGRELPTMSPVSSPVKASLETPKPSRPEVEPGVALPSNPRAEYLIGSSGRRVQLNVTPITIYKTDEQYSLGQLIAVNSSFICYSVKGDMVRILATTNSNLRALVRGHTKSVHDLAFAPTLEADGAALLATTAKDGLLFVWRIAIKDKDITIDAFEKLESRENHFYTRVLWNPAESRQLVTIRSDALVQLWSVTTPGAMNCVRSFNFSSSVLSVAFNATSIAIGTQDGSASIYSHQTGEFQQHWQPHGGKAVTFVALRPGSIVTGTRKNREFRLWDLSTSRLAQEFALTAAQPKSDVSRAFANLASFDASGRFLFIVNTRAPTLYVVHVSGSRFDYASEFSVTYPILSFVMSTLQRPKPADAADDDPLPPPETLVWCLQTAAIQRYHISETQSAPRRVLTTSGLVQPPLSDELMTAPVAQSLLPTSTPPAAAAEPVVTPVATEEKVEAAKPPTPPAAVVPATPAAAEVPASLPAIAETAPRPFLLELSNGRNTPGTIEEEEKDWQRKIEEARREQVAARHSDDGEMRLKHEAHHHGEPHVHAAEPTEAVPVSAPPTAVDAASVRVPTPAEAPRLKEDEAAQRIQAAFRHHLSRRAPEGPAAAPEAAAPTAAASATPAPVFTPPTAALTMTEKDEGESEPVPSAASTSSEPKTPQRVASSKKGGATSKGRKDRVPPSLAATSTMPAITILPRPRPGADTSTAPSAAAPEPAPAAASSSVPPKKSGGSTTSHAEPKAKPETVQLDKHAARALAEQLAPLITRSVQATVAAEMQAILPTLRAAAAPTTLPVTAAAQQLDKNEMREAMQKAFAACFRETVLPAFERATQVMFAQMQAAFEHGLNENLRRMPVPPPAAATPPEMSRLTMENVQLQTALTQQLRSATDTLIHLGEKLQQRIDSPLPIAATTASSSAAPTPSKKGSKHAEANEGEAAKPAPILAPLPVGPVAAAAPPATPEKRKAERVTYTPAPIHTTPVQPHPAHGHPTHPLPLAASAPSVPSDSAILAAGRPRPPEASVPVPGGMSRGMASVPQPLQHPPHVPKPFPVMRNFEELFNYVLNANDLQLVTDVCARHDPAEVFAGPPLSPMVLLPLVQQLGSDLSRALPPKINWLRACLLRLDPRDPLLADMLPDVLQQLKASIEAQRSVERDPNAQAALGSMLGLVSSIMQRL